MHPYQNSKLPVSERVNDLIGRMTLEEKVGQMCQFDGRLEPEKELREKHVGSFLQIMGEKTLELQRIAEKETRLGIPILFAMDCIHGHAFAAEAAVFPTQLALASSWNPGLLEEIGRITAKEMIATGLHWTFSPVLCLARDLRWGRIGETFGEDPLLIGELACAIIRGYQGTDLSGPDSVLACAKHYAGYSDTQGGRDSSEGDMTRRKLLSYFLPPFERAAREGCATFMTGYHSMDGVPCTANRWLLTEMLKDEYGFQGFVVTDWNNVGQLVSHQRACSTMAEAARAAVLAGNDMMMSTPAFADEAVKLVRSGVVAEDKVDEACRRILSVKFRLGLFDHRRYPDLSRAKTVIGCPAHRKKTLDAALESIVLLKNNDVLPVAKSVRKIAVVGPSADDGPTQMGDWSLGTGQAGPKGKGHETVVTVLEGLKQRAEKTAEIRFSKGCDILDAGHSEIGQAVEIGRWADMVIAVVGDALPQTGEMRDRANLDLSGGQQKLLEAMAATGKPLIVVLVNTKPLSIPWVKENAQAILEAWNPGIEGGHAVAAILFGDHNPSGKLAISFPHHVGQQPVYYSQIPGWHSKSYVDMPAEPLFAFGEGLSYTRFVYSNLLLKKQELRKGDSLAVEVELRNEGPVEGVEITQLYIRDLYSSVTMPIKQLRAYCRSKLKPGEQKTIPLSIAFDDLSLIDANLRKMVEPGEFEVMVGASSRDQDLLRASFRVLA